MFFNEASFYGEELSTPLPTPMLEDHPFSAVRDSLFTATLLIGGHSSIHNLRLRQAVVKETRLSRLIKLHRQKYRTAYFKIKLTIYIHRKFETECISNPLSLSLNGRNERPALLFKMSVL